MYQFNGACRGAGEGVCAFVVCFVSERERDREGERGEGEGERERDR